MDVGISQEAVYLSNSSFRTTTSPVSPKGLTGVLSNTRFCGDTIVSPKEKGKAQELEFFRTPGTNLSR